MSFYSLFFYNILSFYSIIFFFMFNNTLTIIDSIFLNNNWSVWGSIENSLYAFRVGIRLYTFLKFHLWDYTRLLLLECPDHFACAPTIWFDDWRFLTNICIRQIKRNHLALILKFNIVIFESLCIHLSYLAEYLLPLISIGIG